MTKETEDKRQIVRDPVCGMWIEPDDAADVEIFKGIIFYFCAPGCKRIFEKEPEKFFSENQKVDSTIEK